MSVYIKLTFAALITGGAYFPDFILPTQGQKKIK